MNEPREAHDAPSPVGMLEAFAFWLKLGFISFEADWDRYFNIASKFFLFASGISGALVILAKVVHAYLHRRKIQKTLLIHKSEKSAISPAESARAG